MKVLQGIVLVVATVAWCAVRAMGAEANAPASRPADQSVASVGASVAPGQAVIVPATGDKKGGIVCGESLPGGQGGLASAKTCAQEAADAEQLAAMKAKVRDRDYEIEALQIRLNQLMAIEMYDSTVGYPLTGDLVRAMCELGGGHPVLAPSQYIVSQLKGR